MQEEDAALAVRNLADAADLGIELMALESAEAVADAVCQWLCRELDLPLARVLTLNPSRSHFTPLGQMGWPVPAAAGEALANEVATEPGYTLALGSHLLWADSAAERRFAIPGTYRSRGVTGGLSMPLRRQQEFFGTVSVHRTDGAGWRNREISTVVLAAGLLVGHITAHGYRDAWEEIQREHAALNQDHALKSSALDTLTELVVITDIRGYVTYVNTAFERETGFRADEVCGTRFAFLKSEASAPDVYHDIWETLVEGRPWSGQVVNDRKDGPDYLEEQTITPVRGSDGQIEHLIAVKRVVEPVFTAHRQRR